MALHPETEILLVLIHEVLPAALDALPGNIRIQLTYTVEYDGIHGRFVYVDAYFFEELDWTRCCIENMGPIAVADYLVARAQAFVQQILDMIPGDPPIEPNFLFKTPIAALFKEGH